MRGIEARDRWEGQRRQVSRREDGGGTSSGGNYEWKAPGDGNKDIGY